MAILTFVYPPVQTSISGGATEAKQDDIIVELGQIESAVDAVNSSIGNVATETTLSSVDAKLTTNNSSLSSIDSKATTTNSSLSSIDSKATTTNSSLSSIDGKITAVDTGAVVVSSSALPTGAATEATLSSIDGKITAVDTGAVVVSSSALPTGAATEATLSAQSAKLPATLGQKTSANSMSVVLSSDQSDISARAGGKTAVNKVRNDYTSTSVTTSAYVQLLSAAAFTTACTEVEIFDSSGQTLVLATGAAASEVDQVYILPGGNGRIPLAIAASTRISVKAVSATASVGEITINFYG